MMAITASSSISVNSVFPENLIYDISGFSLCKAKLDRANFLVGNFCPSAVNADIQPLLYLKLREVARLG